jgi:hypothetical protein
VITGATGPPRLPSGSSPPWDCLLPAPPMYPKSMHTLRVATSNFQSLDGVGLHLGVGLGLTAVSASGCGAAAAIVPGDWCGGPWSDVVPAGGCGRRAGGWFWRPRRDGGVAVVVAVVAAVVAAVWCPPPRPPGPLESKQVASGVVHYTQHATTHNTGPPLAPPSSIIPIPIPHLAPRSTPRTPIPPFGFVPRIPPPQRTTSFGPADVFCEHLPHHIMDYVICMSYVICHMSYVIESYNHMSYVLGQDINEVWRPADLVRASCTAGGGGGGDASPLEPQKERRGAPGLLSVRD